MDRETQLDTHCQHRHGHVGTKRVQLLLLAQTLYVQPRHCHCSSLEPVRFCNYCNADPLERKRKQGRNKATKPCLQRQSVDPANAVQPPGIDDEAEETEPVPSTKKRNTTTTVEQHTSKRQRKN